MSKRIIGLCPSCGEKIIEVMGCCKGVIMMCSCCGSSIKTDVEKEGEIKIVLHPLINKIT